MPEKKKDQNIAYTALPNSVEAEQNVLCCIMRNSELQLEIIAQLNADDFYQPNHAIIFEAMKDISRGYHKVGEENVADTVNFTTVVDSLRRSGNLAKAGDIDYIVRLNDLLPGTANYSEYVSIVKRASTMRKLIEICGNVTKKSVQCRHRRRGNFLRRRGNFQPFAAWKQRRTGVACRRNGTHAVQNQSAFRQSRSIPRNRNGFPSV